MAGLKFEIPYCAILFTSHVTHFHYARNISCKIHRSLPIIDAKRMLHEARKRSAYARIRRPETNSILGVLCDLRPAYIVSQKYVYFSRKFSAIYVNMLIIMENNR